MELVRNLHHYFSMHAQTVAASVKAGVDAMSDPVPVVEEATRQAVCLAQKADTVILALGCHPMVCAKEEIDRTTLALPPRQQTLAEKSAKRVQMQSAFCFPIIRIQSTRSRIVCQRFCGVQLEVRIWERQWQRHCMVKMRRQED